MFGTITRFLLFRVLGRRLIPILTVVELVQFLRRRRANQVDSTSSGSSRGSARGPVKRVGPSRGADVQL